MSNDRAHFDSYREQTEAKHTIVEKYIFAYFNILKSSNKNLVYIDGFAGRGTYSDAVSGEAFDGSPIRALRAISKNDELKKKVQCIFIEKDAVLAKDLIGSVESFHEANPGLRKSRVAVGVFAEKMAEILGRLVLASTPADAAAADPTHAA